MPCDYNNIGVYYIYNKIRCKYYIGSSVNIKNRFSQYIHNLKKGKCHSPKLQNAYNKYGKDAFQFGIVEVCSVESLKEREKYWIDEFNSVFNGYNCSNDTICSTRGLKISEKNKQELSKRIRLKWKEDRDGMLKNSLLALQKASDKRRGSKNSEFHNTAISKANIGKQMSDIVREKHRIRMTNNPINFWKGKKRSKEMVLLLRNVNIGNSNGDRGVIQFDLNGNEVNRFDSAAKAARFLGVGRTSVKNNLLGYSKKCKNSIFKYVSDKL